MGFFYSLLFSSEGEWSVICEVVNIQINNLLMKYMELL